MSVIESVQIHPVSYNEHICIWFGFTILFRIRDVHVDAICISHIT